MLYFRTYLFYIICSLIMQHIGQMLMMAFSLMPKYFLKRLGNHSLSLLQRSVYHWSGRREVVKERKCANPGRYIRAYNYNN